MAWHALGKAAMFRRPIGPGTRTATKLSFVGVAYCCAFLALSTARAATLTWTGSAGDGNIATAGNWSPAQSPGTGDLLIFAGPDSLLPQLSSGLTVGSLNFNNTAGAFTLGGTGTYTITTAAGISNSSANTQTINNNVTLGLAQTWTASTGALVVGGNVNTGAFLLTIAGASNTTIGGNITGTGGLTKSGTGILTLSGTNGYTGTTTLSAGTLVLGSNSAIGPGTLSLGAATLNTGGAARTLSNAITLAGNSIFNGADALTFTGAANMTGSRTLNVSGTGVVTFDGVISGAARKLTKTGAGTLVLNNANLHSGGTALSAGTLVLGNDAAAGTGTLTLTTGTLQAGGGARTIGNLVSLSGNTTYSGANDFTFTNTVTMTKAVTLTINNSVTFGGLVAGAFALTKSGSGILTLGGTVPNTYSGSTTVKDGTLILAKAAGLNAFASATLTIGDSLGAAGSAMVRLNAADQIPDAAMVNIKLDGVLDLQTFTERIAALTTTGGSIIGSGRLDLGGNVTATALTTAVTTVSANLGLNGTRTFLINNNAVSGDNDFIVNGVISDGTTSSSLIKTGLGTLYFGGANTYTGTTDILNGALVVDGSLSLGAVNLGDTVATSNASSLLFGTASGRTIANAINVRAGSTGLLTLGGQNTSGINIFSGAIDLNHTLTVTAATGGEVEFTGAISGAFGLTKTGGGTIRLSHANTFSGLTTISAGTLAYGVSDALGSGGVTINGGILDLGADHSDTVGTVTLTSGSITGTGTSTLTSNANYAVSSGSISVILGGSVGLTKTTTGVATLSGANIYTGATTISAGTLRLGGDNSISSASAVTLSSGATFDLNNFDDAIGSLAGTGGSVTLGTGMLTVGANNSTTTFSGIINGSGGLTKTGSGTFTLSGANTYTGATTISNGTLTLGAANVIADTSAVTVGGGATFNLNNKSETVGSLAGAGSVVLGTATLNAGTDNSSTSFAGAISGTGGFLKSGAGTLTLSGANTFTGGVTLNAGTIVLSGVNGSAANAASFTINSGTTLTLDNSAGDNANRISNTAAIRLGGGTFRFISDSAGSTETVGALNALSGASNVTVVHHGGSGTSSSLIFSSLGTITNGASVNFNSLGGMLGSGSDGAHIFINGLADGFIGGWARVGNDFAEYSADGIRAFSAYYLGADGINVNDASTTVQLTSLSPTSAYTLTNAGTTTDRALVLNDIATLDLGSDPTRTLNLDSGGLIKNSALATTISGEGRLTASGSANGAFSIAVNGSDTLTISSSIINNAGANGIYGDGDDGLVSLTKADSGTLILSGANTYTGTNFLNGGVLQISAENNLGNAGNDVTFNGGTLNVTTGFVADATKVFSVAADLSGTLEINSGQTLTLGNAANILVTGNVASTLFKNGAGALVVQSSNANFVGLLQINAGTVELRDAQSLGDAVNRGRVTLNGGTLNLSNDANTNFANDITVAADSTIDASRLSDPTPSVTHTLGAVAIGGSTLGFTGTNGATVALGAVTLSGNATFDPTTGNAALGAISGSFGWTKTGSGTLTLSGTGSYTGATAINAGTLQLAGANGVSNLSALTLAGGTTFSLNGFSDNIGSLAGAGVIQLGAGTLTAGANNSSTTYSGIVSGSGALTKAGTGVLILSGANTFTGATSVNGGTLRLGLASTLASATDLTVAGGATLDLDSFNQSIGSLSGAGAVALGNATLSVGASNADTVYSGILSGAGGFTKTGSGTLTFSGANNYAGLTSINGGVLLALNGSAFGSTSGGTTVATGAELRLGSAISINGESLILDGNGVAGAGALHATAGGSWTGGITLAGDSTIGSDSGLLTVSGISLTTRALTFIGAGDIQANGVISGSGGVTKNGVGSLTLTAANTYTGLTSVNAGVLRMQDSSALGATGAGNETIVANGAALQLLDAAGLTVGNETLTLNGSGVAGAGAIDVGAGDNTWNGNVVLASNSAIGIQNLDDSLILNGTLSESGGARSLTKAGAGTLILAGSSTRTGATFINGGTLQLAAAERIHDNSAVVVASGATFDLNDNSETVGSVAGAGTISLGVVSSSGTKLTTGGDGTSTTFSGVITGTGGLAKSGTGVLTLTGANNFTGATTVETGTLLLGTTSGSALASTTSITVNSGGTLLLGASNQINNAAGVVLAGGTFAKGNFNEGATNSVGMGALTLTAAGSKLDFGTGTIGTLSFASFIPSGNILTILNWTGLVATVGNNATDRLIFNSSQSGNLASFAFSGFAAGATQFDLGGGFFEVTPLSAVPEPGTYAAGALALIALLYSQRRRLRRRVATTQGSTTRVA